MVRDFGMKREALAIALCYPRMSEQGLKTEIAPPVAPLAQGARPLRRCHNEVSEMAVRRVDVWR